MDIWYPFKHQQRFIWYMFGMIPSVNWYIFGMILSVQVWQEVWGLLLECIRMHRHRCWHYWVNPVRRLHRINSYKTFIKICQNDDFPLQLLFTLGLGSFSFWSFSFAAQPVQSHPSQGTLIQHGLPKFKFAVRAEKGRTWLLTLLAVASSVKRLRGRKPVSGIGMIDFFLTRCKGFVAIVW